MIEYMAVVRLPGAPGSNKVVFEAANISFALEEMVKKAGVESTSDLEVFTLFEIVKAEGGGVGYIPRAERLETVRKSVMALEPMTYPVNQPLVVVKEHTGEEEYKVYEIEDA